MFGFLFSSRCQVCGCTLKRNRYKWKIRGATALVCPNCNSRLESKVSSAAFGGDADFPEIKPRGGCAALIKWVFAAFVLFIAGTMVLAWLLQNKTPTQAASPQTTASQTLPPQPEPPKIPLFANPQSAVQVPVELGLADDAPQKPRWRNGGLGEWYGLAMLKTHEGGFTKPGDIDNTIQCFHTSKHVHKVEKVRWSANVFNEAGSESTLPKFKALCLQYCQRLGCQVPEGLFENVDPAKGQKFETKEGIFELKKLTDFKFGHGWEFTIISK